MTSSQMIRDFEEFIDNKSRKREFTVEVGAVALVSGIVKVEASTLEEAKAKVRELIAQGDIVGDIDWKYEGLFEKYPVKVEE